MKDVTQPAGIRISREEINALPLFHYRGEVTFIRTEEELADAVSRIKRLRVVGFDSETKPSFRKGKVNPPSLVQIASRDEVFLFHLRWVPLGECLASVFGDETIIKTGVAIENDLRYLNKLYPFSSASTLDLGSVAKQNGLDIQSLRGLVAYFLQVHISKTEQCSNWGKKNLTHRQVRYAATDAWVSLAIFERMLELGMIAPSILSNEPGKNISGNAAAMDMQ